MISRTRQDYIQAWMPKNSIEVACMRGQVNNLDDLRLVTANCSGNAGGPYHVGPRSHAQESPYADAMLRVQRFIDAGFSRATAVETVDIQGNTVEYFGFLDPKTNYLFYRDPETIDRPGRAKWMSVLVGKRFKVTIH